MCYNSLFFAQAKLIGIKLSHFLTFSFYLNTSSFEDNGLTLNGQILRKSDYFHEVKILFVLLFFCHFSLVLFWYGVVAYKQTSGVNVLYGGLLCGGTNMYIYSMEISWKESGVLHRIAGYWSKKCTTVYCKWCKCTFWKIVVTLWCTYRGSLVSI